MSRVRASRLGLDSGMARDCVGLDNDRDSRGVSLMSARRVWSGIERRDGAIRERLVRRVRLEYEELPGMSLTAEQAARLFALRPDVCRRIFEELVQAGVLQRRWEGRKDQYVVRRPAR